MAKIKGTCPHCGTESRYDASAAGLHVSCPECSGRFQLDYARRPRRGCLASCATIIVGLVLVGAVVAGAAMYFSDSLLPLLENMEIVKEQPPPAPEHEAPPPDADVAPAPQPEAGSPEPSYEQRNWVDNTGSFSVEATLIEVVDGSVRLEKQSGEIIEVPLERLSAADQKYVAETWSEDAAKE
jgi:hypothetical protein